jgi:hypothetical protein
VPTAARFGGEGRELDELGPGTHHGADSHALSESETRPRCTDGANGCMGEAWARIDGVER